MENCILDIEITFDLRKLNTDRERYSCIPFLANVGADKKCYVIQLKENFNPIVLLQACSGRMVGYATDGSPFIELYVTENPPPSNTATKAPTEPVLVNRTLVDRGVASWVEHDVPVLGGLVPEVWGSSDEKFESCLLAIYADKHTLFWSPWDLNTKPICWDDQVSADVPRPQISSPINGVDDNARLKDFEIMNQKNAKQKLYRIKQKIRKRNKANVQWRDLDFSNIRETKFGATREKLGTLIQEIVRVFSEPTEVAHFALKADTTPTGSIFRLLPWPLPLFALYSCCPKLGQ